MHLYEIPRIGKFIHIHRASQVALLVKNPSANAGDTRDVGSIPVLGRSSEGGHGNPLQYSCLENPMDRGAWQAIVQEATKSDVTDHTHDMHMKSKEAVQGE